MGYYNLIEADIALIKPPLNGTVIMAQYFLGGIFNRPLRKTDRLAELMEIIRSQSKDENLESLKKSVIRNMFADSNISSIERRLFKYLEPFKCGWGRYNIKSYFDVSEEATDSVVRH